MQRANFPYIKPVILTMIELWLIRHAHAGPHLEPDVDRALSLRGQAEAKRSAMTIKYSGHEPGIWLVSAAARTQETANILLESNAHLCLSRVNAMDLYTGDGRYYLNLLEQSTHPRVYIVGHNPSISWLASHVSNQYLEMGTGDVLHLQWNFTQDWQEISAGMAQVNYHFIAREPYE